SEESRASRLTPVAHPLLGSPLGDPRPAWEARLDLRLTPYLADHRVQEAVLLPATAYLELALACAREVFGPGPCVVEEARLANPCFLSPDRPLHLHTAFAPESGTVEIHTRPVGAEEWTAHFTAVLRSREADNPALFSPAQVGQRCPQEFSREQCSAYPRKIGL